MEDKCKACATEVATRLGSSLKDKQLEAILGFMSGKDVFVSLPTGYGKSLIYAVLHLVRANNQGLEAFSSEWWL